MITLSMAKWLQTMLMFIALAVLTTALSGCNTSKGFGEDVESLGDDIQDEAEEAN